MTRIKFMVFGATVLGVAILASFAQAANFTWEGAGRTGGTRDPIWTTGGNWQVAAVPQASPPSLTDDATITFNASYNPGVAGQYALEIDAGAQARDVVISGFENGINDNRRVLVTGNAEFSSLRVGNGGTNSDANSVFTLDTGAVLTLTGGSVATPTLRDGSSAAPSPIVGAGSIVFPGQNVFMSLVNEISVGSVSFTNTSPSATIENNNLDFEFRGSTLSIRSTHTLNNFPLLRLDGASNLVSGDGNPLHNFSNVGLGVYYRFGNASAPEGTYAYLTISENVSSTGNPRYRLAGNQEIVSDSVGDGSGNAVTILRAGRNSTFGALYVDGYDLNVSSTAPVEVGGNDAFTSRSELNMTGGAGGTNSNVTLAGDLILNEDGALIGDAGTTLSVGGDFRNGSLDDSSYDMTAATVILDGGAPQFAEQGLEVQGLDQGAASHAAGMTQFGIGDLFIGTGLGQPSWVELVDEFDFDNDSISDAMYVDALTVEQDSFLVLNGLNLYVNGTQVFAGDTQYGGGTIINFSSEYTPPVPEPTSFVLLSLGLLFLRRKRGRGEK